jgi:hypothetical protein
VQSTNGVYGSTAASGSGGVSGVNQGSGPGVLGTGNGGDGIDGFSASGFGVLGISTNGSAGVHGYASTGNGVEGVSSTGAGVEGGTINGPYGVYGLSEGYGVAVYGLSEGGGAGVEGGSIGSGPAGQFDGNVNITGTVSFGNEVAQMLNLYSTTYAIGVQDSDEFFRTGNSFFWYNGGAYAGDFGDAGSGGTKLMQLGNTGNLIVKGTVTANGVLLASDRNAKENFHPLDNQVVLAKLASLPLTAWNYKTDSKEVQHIGPMAQDFQAAFGLDGADDKHISVMDEGGVALAAIQGLNQKLEAETKEKDAEIQSLKQSVSELKQLVQSFAAQK